ncbi:MAG: hypothetical protein QM704_12070 [Anaeromyxobacteraceae bacterium]
MPRETLTVELGLPPGVARAALRRMIETAEPPALFRAGDGLAGEEVGGELIVRIVPAAGSMALFEARARVEPTEAGSRVRLLVGPRPGATSFFWSLGSLVVSAGIVLLVFGHPAGAVTLCLPLLGWWGRFVGESVRLVRVVRGLAGGRTRAVLFR